MNTNGGGFLTFTREELADPYLKGHPERLAAWVDLKQRAEYQHRPDVLGVGMALERGDVVVTVRVLMRDRKWKSLGRVHRFLNNRVAAEKLVRLRTGKWNRNGTRTERTRNEGTSIFRFVKYDSYTTPGAAYRTPNGTETEQERNGVTTGSFLRSARRSTTGLSTSPSTLSDHWAGSTGWPS